MRAKPLRYGSGQPAAPALLAVELARYVRVIRALPRCAGWPVVVRDLIKNRAKRRGGV